MQECIDLLFDIISLFVLLYDRHWAGTQWAEPKGFAKVVRPPSALIHYLIRIICINLSIYLYTGH